MNTLIIYISNHGTTEKVAKMIAEYLHDQKPELINLRENQNVDLSVYDNILIGGSIHAGMVQKKLKEFCDKNQNILTQKNLGLFLCCMMKEKQEEEFETAFPLVLREHAKAKLIPGGEFIFKEMNFFEKAIVKKVSGIKTDISDLDQDKIKDFAMKFVSSD